MAALIEDVRMSLDLDTIPVFAGLVGVVFGAVQVALPLASYRSRARWTRRLEGALDLRAKLPEEVPLRSTLDRVVRIAAAQLDALESVWVLRRTRQPGPTVAEPAVGPDAGAPAPSAASVPPPAIPVPTLRAPAASPQRVRALASRSPSPRPLLGGVVLAISVGLLIAFRQQLGEGSASAGQWLTDNPGPTIAFVAALVIAVGINWVAHVTGRLRAWIYALAVEIGLWVWFWNGLGIPPLKELVGLDRFDGISVIAQVVSGFVILTVAGSLYWVLEARERWLVRSYAEE